MSRLAVDVVQTLTTDLTLPRRDQWPSPQKVGHLEQTFVQAVLECRNACGWRQLVDWYLDGRNQIVTESPPVPFVRIQRFGAGAADFLDTISECRGTTLNPYPFQPREATFSVSAPVWRVIAESSRGDSSFVGSIEKQPLGVLCAREFLFNYLQPRSRRDAQSSNALALVSDALLDRLRPSELQFLLPVTTASIAALTFDSRAVSNVLVRVLSAADPAAHLRQLRLAAITAAESVALYSPVVRRALEPVALRGSKAEQKAARRILDVGMRWASIPEQIGKTLAKLRIDRHGEAGVAEMAFLDCTFEQPEGVTAMDEVRMARYHQERRDEYQIAASGYREEVRVTAINQAAELVPLTGVAGAFFAYTDPWNMRLTMTELGCQAATKLARTGYAALNHPTTLSIDWTLPPDTSSSGGDQLFTHASFPPLGWLRIRGPIDDNRGVEVARAIARTQLRSLDLNANDDYTPGSFHTRSGQALLALAKAAATNPLRRLIFDGNTIGTIVVQNVRNSETGETRRVPVVGPNEANRTVVEVLAALEKLVSPGRLEDLSFNGCGIPHGARDNLSAVLRLTKNLTSLGLGGNPFLFCKLNGIQGPLDLIEVIGALPLARLDLSGRTLERSRDALAVVMARSTRIEYLNLGRADLGFWDGTYDHNPARVGYSLDLTAATNLERVRTQKFLARLVASAGALNLSGCDLRNSELITQLLIPGEGVARVALNVGDLHRPFAGIVPFLVSRGLSQALTHLDLTGNPLTKQDAKLLVQSFPKLRHVSVARCGLNRSSLRMLVDGISSDIETLDLSGNYVRSRDVQRLGRIPRPLLARVGLTGTGLTDNDVRALVDSHCLTVLREIRNDEGTVNVLAERAESGGIASNGALNSLGSAFDEGIK